ncbi:hypothetical protein NFC81_14100 [Salinispirillum sp. LH 10-3-1]|uniref:Ig-like domain-containing protein n=1 Tax=Salinispirillum sp. LH 10-3-1 TaxID=2952525 RepID=A0AB38YFI9_9GAMM
MTHQIRVALAVLLSTALLGCIEEKKDRSQKFTSTPVTEVAVGQLYRYDITVAPTTAADLNITSAGLPSWLTVEYQKRVPTPIDIGMPSEHVTAIAIDSDDNIYFAYGDKGIYKTQRGIGSSELVLDDVCGSNRGCQAMVVRGDTLYFTDDEPGTRNVIYTLDLNNPNSGKALFSNDVVGPIVALAIHEGHLYASAWNSGTPIRIYKYNLNIPQDPREKRTSESQFTLSGGLGYSITFGPEGVLYNADGLSSSLKGYVPAENDQTSYTETYAFNFNPGCPHLAVGDSVDGVYVYKKGCTPLFFQFVPPPRVRPEIIRIVPSTNEQTTIYQGAVDAITLDSTGVPVWSVRSTDVLWTLGPQKATLTGMPSEGDIGDHKITLTLPSGDKQEFTVTVSAGESAPTFKLSGTVLGLIGNVILEDRSTNTFAEAQGGSYDNGFVIFGFSTGENYDLGIVASPENQLCSITGDRTGTFAEEDINVGELITCRSVRSLSVSVVGLSNDGTTVPLRSSGPEDGRWLVENKAFGLGTDTFTNTFFDDEMFDVRVIADPEGYTCTIEGNGLGTVNGNVTIAVTCTASGGGSGPGGPTDPGDDCDEPSHFGPPVCDDF